ncbi:DUF1674 domain-containing protein [Roseixanthobacter glucoisosaccharinicivorans]|uniref:DUF1674 domain-containing protein n=1 Tax=Roseixanthobacter glucoisosaccharinicivorans TaxID=3119923 RepID=UPI00372BEA91
MSETETRAPAAAPGKPLSPAAQRALAEAAERRAAIDAVAKSMPKEVNGRGGTEPVRYGDWEVGGIASDF